MKRLLAFTVQFLLFLFVDAVGSLLYHPFHIQTVLSGNATAPRSFLWDGILLTLLAYLLVVAVAALRKRIAESALGSTLAFILATLAGYLLRFGFITHNW